MQTHADKGGGVSLRGEGLLGRDVELNRDSDVCDRVQQQVQAMGFFCCFRRCQKS